MNLAATPVFERNFDSTAKIVVNRGGTRSSKTYSIQQLCALWLLSGVYGNGQTLAAGVWSTVRKFRTTLDGTVVRDFEEVLHSLNAYDMVKHDKTRKTYSFEGRTVEFIGADDEQKLRGAKRGLLYCNEANELKYKQEFFQLLMRTELKIYLDFNPDDEGVWINTEIEQKRARDKGDVEVIVSNYKDNTFLSAAQVDEIEYLEKTDPEFWKIYGLGEYGHISGLIFERFEVIDEVPEGAKFLCYGLDFGFTADPTAMYGLYRYDGAIILDEVIYQTGLTNNDIFEVATAEGVTRSDLIICDSAEPKSIEELYRLGLNCKPCKKGKDSINNGIDILKRYDLKATAKSTGIIKEQRRYKWATDKNDKPLNKPVSKFDHAWDAVRYAATEKLGHSNKGRYSIR